MTIFIFGKANPLNCECRQKKKKKVMWAHWSKSGILEKKKIQPLKLCFKYCCKQLGSLESKWLRITVLNVKNVNRYEDVPWGSDACTSCSGHGCSHQRAARSGSEDPWPSHPAFRPQPRSLYLPSQSLHCLSFPKGQKQRMELNVESVSHTHTYTYTYTYTYRERDIDR